MQAASTGAVGWPAHERRAVVGAALAMFAVHASTATWNVITLPAQQQFDAGPQGELLLRQAADVAGLLAVPLVGVLGGRIPAFRLTLAAAALMLAGSALMVSATALGWLLLGMGLTSVGRTIVTVMGMSVVGSSVADSRRRATAFAAVGMSAPLAFIVSPLTAALLASAGGWRLVSVIWFAGALVVLGSAGWLRWAASPPSLERREPWTPLLAGVALVCLVQWLGAIVTQGALSGASAAWLGGLVAAGGGWWLLVKLLRRPSLDGRTLRVPGLVAVLLVAMLAQCGDLWFYAAAFAVHVQRDTPLQVGLALLPPQLASVFGAATAGWLARRHGLRMSGTLLLGLLAIALFASCGQTVEGSVWFTVVVACAYGLGEAGGGVCITQAVMATAPAGLESQVSSCRSAATGVGNALATLLITSSVGFTMGQSMRQRAQEAGVAPARTEQLVEVVHGNVPNSEAARRLHLDPAALEQLRQVRREVIVDGYRAHGLVSGSVIALATVGFWIVRRRKD